MVVLKRLMVCPRKQELYLPWAAPKAEIASEVETDKRQFSAQMRRGFWSVLTPRAAGDADKRESPVTGSNAGKGWSFVMSVTSKGPTECGPWDSEKCMR